MNIEKSKSVKDMAAVAEDIIKLEFTDSSTIGSMKEAFFTIMEKHGICQGEKVGNGIQGSNYEWTMCSDLFLQRIIDHTRFSMFFTDSIPEKLRYYKKMQ